MQDMFVIKTVALFIMPV